MGMVEALQDTEKHRVCRKLHFAGAYSLRQVGLERFADAKLRALLMVLSSHFLLELNSMRTGPLPFLYTTESSAHGIVLSI